MTPIELEAFLKAQAQMSTRIARKAARVRKIAVAIAQSSGGGKSLGLKVLSALTRPGVCPTQRPKSPDGKQTFHFALTTVNQTSDFVAKFRGAKKGQSAAHESYIERDGAAERLGAQFAKTSSDMREEVWEALGGQNYIERPDAAETVDGLRIASFGNIADTLEDRLAYWRAMEEAAAKPTTNGIELQRGNDPAFWAKVDADPKAPQILKNAPPFVPLPANENDQAVSPGLNVPVFRPKARYSDKLASEVLDYVRKHRGKTKAAKDAPAVVIDPGRGGRIQSRIIVELPHELTPAQRLKLAQDYCHKKFVEGRDAPLQHWCVIHAPDHHNDPRNVHMHIVFAERPAARMIHPETGKECWDFEVQIKVKDEHKHNRLKRPFEQKTDRSINNGRWVGQARKDFAALANAALKAAGRKKVYDARTYKAMGITEKPRDRVNAKDYRKEKQGETTTGADVAINAQWEREEQRLSARFNKFGAPKRNLDAFDFELARWKFAPNGVWGHLVVHRHEYAVSTAYLNVMRAEKAANAFVLAKIQSKILPPLQAKDEDALLAQDFIRMFKHDIVETHAEGMRVQKRNAERSLKALMNAQQADPKATKSADFLTGRITPVLTLPFGPGDFDQGTSPIEMLNRWRDGRIEDIREAREMRAVQAEQMAARHGRVVPDPQAPSSTPTVDLSVAQTQAAPAAQATTTERTPSPNASPSAQAAGQQPAVPTPELKTSPKPATRRPPDLEVGKARVPQGSSQAPEEVGKKIEERPISPDGVMTGIGWTPTSPEQKDAYARALRVFTPGGLPKGEIGGIAAAPENLKVYGDEVVLPFFSETGSAIQHRVFSAKRIRTADEQAAAVEAAIKKRKEERRAKLEAEVAAMRARSRAEIAADRAKEAAEAAADARARHTDVTIRKDPVQEPPAKTPSTTPSPQTATTPPKVDQTRREPVLDPTTRVAPTAHTTSRLSDNGKVSSPATSVSQDAQTRPAPSRPVIPDIDTPKPASTNKTPSGRPNAGSPVASSKPEPQLSTGPSATDKATTTNLTLDKTALSLNSKRGLTADELRKRALLAAKSRGRGR